MPSKLRDLHRCQEGGVQTLSFVLTLPVFVMLILFIVQVSQVMIGITVVHYAAFAAARAASVWIPAEMTDSGEPANQVFPGAMDPNVTHPKWSTLPLNYYNGGGLPSWKCQKIWSAAVMACMPISPSHQYLTNPARQQSESLLAATTIELYQKLDSRSVGNPQIPNRIRNKSAYASEHTWITISGTDAAKNTSFGPTYNPYDHLETPDEFMPEYDFPSQWQFRPYEIGWQDPITVEVTYRFALLPGPGRFLATRLKAADGTRDKVSRRIHIWSKDANPQYSESVYYTVLSASATMTNDGLKSIIPCYRTAEALR